VFFCYPAPIILLYFKTGLLWPNSINALTNLLYQNWPLYFLTWGLQHLPQFQSKSLPPMIEGKDILAQAQTGSGKTPRICHRSLTQNAILVSLVSSFLVMCPTRELCRTKYRKKYARWRSYKINIKVLSLVRRHAILAHKSVSFEHGAHIGCWHTGALNMEHLRKGNTQLKCTQYASIG